MAAGVTGTNDAVSAVASQLAADPTPVNYGAVVRAAPDNAQTVLLAFESTAGPTAYPLAAGESVAVFREQLATGDLRDIWLTTAGTGTVYFYGV